MVTIAGGFNTLHDFAQNIYDFLHAAQKDAAGEQSKDKVVISRKGEASSYTISPLKRLKKYFSSDTRR